MAPELSPNHAPWLATRNFPNDWERRWRWGFLSATMEDQPVSSSPPPYRLQQCPGDTCPCQWPRPAAMGEVSEATPPPRVVPPLQRQSPVQRRSPVVDGDDFTQAATQKWCQKWKSAALGFNFDLLFVLFV